MYPHSMEEELAFFRDKALEFEPGTRFAYSIRTTRCSVQLSRR